MDTARSNNAGPVGVSEIPECRGQGDRRPALFERAVSIPGIAHLSAAGLRRLRSAAHVLGDRYHKDALLLATVRDDVHRGIALAQGPRPRTGHGRGALRLVGLEAHPLT